MAETDIFRDSLLRYLGYANEVGESFRSVVAKKWVTMSYVVASSYVLADTMSKSMKTWRTSDPGDSSKQKSVKTAITAVDVLLWQSFASVIVPGFIINRLCAGTRYALSKSKLVRSCQTVRWISVGVGLVSIPLIIHPIDNGVDYVMDKSVRPALGIDLSTHK